MIADTDFGDVDIERAIIEEAGFTQRDQSFFTC
jgi:hypothetical protein